MNTIRKAMMLALGLSLLAGPLAADEPGGDEALKQARKAAKRREAVMYLLGWSAGPMGAMVKEQAPYDPMVFEKQAGRLADLSRMVEDLYRADLRKFDLGTEAKPEIWDDYAEFERLAAELVDSARALAQGAAGRDLAAARQAFVAVADDCKACHEKFREEDH